MNNLSEISTTKAVNLLNSEPGRILAIDDRPLSRMTTVDLLSIEGYEVVEADGSSDLFNYILETNPDLILLDLMLPQIDGFELCKQLKQDERTCRIPVIFITIGDDRLARLRCLEAGGEDLLTKPLDPLVLSARVKSSIQQKRLNEGLDQTEQVLFSIARAIESRAVYKENSPTKLDDLAKAFGEYLELSLTDIENLVCAAHLHDIGTVVIPDAVMLKTGELTPEEREIIHQHVLIGEEICQPLRNRRGVLPIIRHHHERWDGSGYPDGLTGSNIPFLAQVFQILDIYDALTSKRPHKEPFSPEQALEIIREETAKGWRNPKLVDRFITFIRDNLANITEGKSISAELKQSA
jgi:putative two-component system response regulator